jgi:hypothetical protein
VCLTDVYIKLKYGGKVSLLETPVLGGDEEKPIF